MEIIVIEIDNVKVIPASNVDLYTQFKGEIGGWLENVRPQGLPAPYVMIVDEEGLIKDLPRNLIPSMLYGNTIAGKTIICKEVLGDEGADWSGLEEDEINSLLQVLQLLAQIGGTK